MSAADVDRLLTEPAVVLGSLPPLGRDLDLLVSQEQSLRLARDLLTAGWLQCGRTFVRFGAGTAYAVDLLVLSQWAPSPEVADRVRAAAEPLAGYSHLLSPAAHHRLLILAHRFRNGMHVDDRKRARLAAFSADDWAAARAESDSWKVMSALSTLERSASALVSISTTTSRRRLLRSVVRRRRGRVISLSGLDGAGKSTHAEYLRQALEAVGFDACIEWTKIARDPVLGTVGRPVKAGLRWVTRSRPVAVPPGADIVAGSAVEERNYPDGPPPPPDAGRLLRERYPLLTWGWTVIVCWANARNHRRTVTRHLAAGRVVICDRYVLDSLAHLRYRYGRERRFRLQTVLIRLFSPRPVCAFLLDVAPETARARKPEQYTTPELAVLRSLYHEEAARLAVVVVDAERVPTDVATELAATAWRRLTR